MAGRDVGPDTRLPFHERASRFRGGGPHGLLRLDDGARNHDIHVPDRGNVSSGQPLLPAGWRLSTTRHASRT